MTERGAPPADRLRPARTSNAAGMRNRVPVRNECTLPAREDSHERTAP